MALQAQINGGASLQYFCHTRRCSSFPSTATSAAIPSFVSAFPSRSALRVASQSPEKLQQHCRPLRCAAAASSREATVVDAASENHTELPPLLATVLAPGLPPCQGSPFVEEALEYVKDIGPADNFEAWFHVGLSFISFVHCNAVTAERLAAMTETCTLMTMLDDLLIDNQDPARLASLGVDPAILDSPDSIYKYMTHAVETFRREDRPENPNRLEELLWQSGRDLRALCPTPEPWNRYADAFRDFLYANYEVYRDGVKFENEETYIAQRWGTVGIPMMLATIPLCLDSYLPAEVLEHPDMQRLNKLAMDYNTYNQDIFSYARDIAEGSSNVIKLVMDSNPGMTLEQASWQVLKKVRGFAEEFLELEATMELPKSWEEKYDVPLYLLGVKEAMAGLAYWHSRCKRYRIADSPFPEMRDENVPFLPVADAIKVISK